MTTGNKALAAIAMLAACGCSPQPAPQATAETEEPAPRPAMAAPKISAEPPASSLAAPQLAVEGEGLRLFDARTGAARPLPFGMPQRQVLSILEGFRGPADGGTNSECGPGPLDYSVWADGLTLQFQEGTFAGWALDERAEGAHATASGIGPGSSRKELEAVYDAEVEQSSLGTEFRAGGISGVLEGTEGKARIKAMWAGANCVFR